MIIWWSTTMFVSAAAGLVCGVMFNAYLRALLKQIPLVGKYF